MNKKQYYDEKIMIFSKFIIGYGGVQKTSMQLVETLDKTGNIEIFSNVFSDKKYNLKNFN